MIQGNAQTALRSPFSVVLTKSVSLKFFGNENPIGKSLQYNNQINFTVTGVVQDPPANSTLQFDYLGSLNSMPDIWGDSNLLKKKNDNFNYYTYILLRKGSEAAEIEKDITKKIAGFWSRPVIGLPLVCKFHIESLKEQYWDNRLEYDMPVKGNKNGVTAFAVIAVLILLIACVNFINISTAQSLTRAKEVGIRKVLGDSVRSY